VVLDVDDVDAVRAGFPEEPAQAVEDGRAVWDPERALAREVLALDVDQEEGGLLDRPTLAASLFLVGKGYAEGPAAEERFAELERAERLREVEHQDERAAVYGSTPDRPEKHFIGWLGEVDPDELFGSGEAWGLSVVRRRA
jgi:hypothetical protein